MREFKFRAWDKRDKLMKTPVTLRQLIDFALPINIANDYEFMQFTGAKDCFGSEIYEGDIVFLDSKMLKGEIVMDFYAWKMKSGDDFFWLCDYPNDLHVIGNIYESPQLLESTK